MAKTPLFHLVQRTILKAKLYSENRELFHAVQELEQEAASGLDRRKFLQKMALVGAMVPLSNVFLREAFAKALEKHSHVPSRGRPLHFEESKDGRQPASQSNGGPVTIIGAGFAGLAAAYRLTKKGIPVELYEASARVGGRVNTRANFNSDGMFVEMGAELIDSGHEDIITLAKELNLPLDDFTPYDEGFEKEQYYFQGRVLFEADLIPAFAPLADYLSRDIAELFPANTQWVINYKTHSSAAPKFDKMSLYDYLYSKKNVDKWVLDLINQAYTGECGLETQKQSAINLLFLIDPDTSKGFKIFGESDERFRIRGGNSRLTDALLAAIRPTVSVQFGHELMAIKDNGTKFTLSFKTGSKTVAKSASQIICTLPPTVLRKVTGISTLGLSPVKLKFIKELGFGTNGKMMVGFKKRFWREKNGKIAAYTGSAFNDLKTQAFWETSRAQAGKSGILTNFSGGAYGAKLSSNDLPTVLADLNLANPGIKDFHDGNMVLMRWTTNPLTLGSYSCPLLGQYTTICGAGSEPELGGRFLLAGESCSEKSQAFMNGAIETGNYSADIVISQRHGIGSHTHAQKMVMLQKA